MTPGALLLLPAAVVTVAAGAQHAPAKETYREVAFVSAEDDDTLVAVDLGTRRVLGRILVANGPHNVAASASAGRNAVLVTSPPAGRVTLVSASSRRVVHVFRGLAYPHDVELSPGGRYAYVTEERGSAVAVLDLARRRVVRRVRVASGPHDLAVSPAGGEVWVTHGPRAGSVTILDTSRPTRARVVGKASVRGTHDIAFACGGRRVWVTYWDSGLVGALDVETRRLVKRTGAGTLVHHVQAGPGGRRIWTTDHAGGAARLLDACTGRLRRTFRVGRAPHHVAVSPVRHHAVVASHEAGTIAVWIPLLGRWHGRTVRVGEGLHGVAVALVP